MNNTRLLTTINVKISKLRDEIVELSLKTDKDENFDIIFDSICEVISDLESIESRINILSTEIN